MDQSTQYGQMDFNLPHDIVSLPTKGVFYKSKKESLKVGYLTASDENYLVSPNIISEGVISTLLKNKIYEPGFDISQLLNVDVQAILIFLRNTSFGSTYDFKIKDPKTDIFFETSIELDRISIKPAEVEPNSEGLFEFVLPKSKKKVLLRLLNFGDERDIDKIREQYPDNMVAPIITKRLERTIVSLDGNTDREHISKFITQLPIADSKELRKFLNKCEPQLDLQRTIMAPSGEKVTIDVSFGAEFFRPFFGL